MRANPGSLRKAALGNHVLADRAAADEVLLDDPLEDLGRAAAVPGPLRVHDSDRTVSTHLQTVRLRAVDPAAAHEAQLEILPRESSELAVRIGVNHEIIE